MNTPRLHHRAAPWVLALVFALLWLTGWGQVHRVLHPGVQTVASAKALTPSATPGLAHEDGGSLCQLLDQLSHGGGPVMAASLALPSAAPLASPISRAEAAPSTLTRAFEARGPPRLS